MSGKYSQILILFLVISNLAFLGLYRNALGRIASIKDESPTNSSKTIGNVDAARHSATGARPIDASLADGNAARLENHSPDDRTVIIAREALQYLRYDAFGPNMRLTPAFRLVSGATEDEIARLSKITGDGFARLSEVRAANTLVTKNGKNEAVIEVGDFEGKMRDISRSILTQAKKSVSPDVFEVFDTAYRDLFNRNSDSTPKQNIKYSIKTRLGGDGSKIYLVAQTSKDTGAYILNEYSKAEFLKSIPCASILELAK